MVPEVKFGAKILLVHSRLNVKVKKYLQTGIIPSLYVIEWSIWKIPVKIVILVSQFRNNH